MFRKRQGCLIAIAFAALVMPSARAADEPDTATEPDFRLLKIAEALADSSVLPVQFEDPNLFGGGNVGEAGQQGIQPIDTGPTQGFESLAASAFEQEFSFGDWSVLGKADLGSETTSIVDSVDYVEKLEEVQGTSEVALTESPAVDIVSAGTFNLSSTPDVAETLIDAPSTQTVRARRRSQVGFDPRIRGFYNGQIYTMHDGSYQFPVRSDLDGVFSKIDQSLIGNVQVFSGPYTVRYGSAFSFLNVDTIPAPRYECGWENHLRLGTSVRTNGGQTYNTATLYGGGESVGYFANVGFRKGSDYEAGDGLLVPSSYDAFNLFTGIGFDINEDTRSEIRYTRIDQDNTEYAGQFFDVDDLKSDGLTHSLIHRDERNGFAYRVDSWINNTEFNGDTSNGSKRRADFPVLQRVDAALSDGNIGGIFDPNRPFFGAVDGELLSAGTRAGITKELDRTTTFGMGMDVRYVRQQIAEAYDLTGFFPGPGFVGFETGLPTAELVEPGMYAEYSFALRKYIQTAVGARVSFAHTQADPDDINLQSNFRDGSTNEIDEDLDVSDVLISYFLTNDIELAPAWKLRLGGGYAERLPNLEQRYSDGLFLAIIQSGFSRVIGDPSLSKERNWQVDARMDMDYEYIRARLSGFHSWVVDYITYEANEVLDPQGARLLRAINTDYATLTGFESYCEADLSPGWQIFGSLAYLDGRDREIDQPLAGINPLEGRLGFRWTDTAPENRWGVEWGLRMVDNQDRLGTLRAVAPATGVIELETATPGFTTSYLRGYMQPRDNVNVTFGVENLFDNNYFEHLNLRIPPDGSFGPTVVLSPGFTPYFGVELDY